MYLLIGVLLLQHDRQSLQEGPHARSHVEANYTLLLQCGAASGQHMVGHHELFRTIHNQYILERNPCHTTTQTQTHTLEADHKINVHFMNYGEIKNQVVLPLTCWSRLQHPHLGSRQYSGLPLNQLLLSGARTHPFGHGHTNIMTSVERYSVTL